MEIIAIAGGSGSGKSTTSYELVDGNPGQFEVINLDDYQFVGSGSNIPVVNGMRNRDHPDAIDWSRLRQDIQTLRDGGEIKLQTWSHRSNPDFRVHKQRIQRVVTPHPVIIIEGCLALYGAIADVYDRTFYLDLDEPTRMERRRQARGGLDSLSGNPGYNEQILLPMHRQYVEPTRAFADEVLEVRGRTAAELAHFILERLSITS